MSDEFIANLPQTRLRGGGRAAEDEESLDDTGLFSSSVRSDAITKLARTRLSLRAFTLLRSPRGTRGASAPESTPIAPFLAATLSATFQAAAAEMPAQEAAAISRHEIRLATPLCTPIFAPSLQP